MTKCDTSRVKPGDKWSRHSYGTVVQVGCSVEVRNEQGFTWTVGAGVFEKEFVVADQYHDTVQLTRTELITKILEASRVAMTIKFRKKPDPKMLVALVNNLLDCPENRPKPRTLSKMLKEATAGEEREIQGRHYGIHDEHGRLQFTSMEEGTSGLRVIDPRTIEYAIIEQVKYVLK